MSTILEGGEQDGDRKEGWWSGGRMLVLRMPDLLGNGWSEDGER